MYHILPYMRLHPHMQPLEEHHYGPRWNAAFHQVNAPSTEAENEPSPSLDFNDITELHHTLTLSAKKIEIG